MCQSFRQPYLVFLIIGILFIPTIVLSQKQIKVSNLKKDISIDGNVDEKEWSGSSTTAGLIQLEPDKAAPASEETIIHSFYDDQYIYFGIKCLQKSIVVANVQTRDNVLKNDDAIKIVLDTYLDKRSAYCFTINPLGTQTDFRINDDGRNINYDWDTEWQSAAKVFPWGWSAEMAIPFKSIKYRSSIKQWGINFGRIIRNNSEISWWSEALNSDYRISQNGLLTGINPPAQDDKVMITPYVSLRFEDSDITGNYNKLKPDAGVDFRYRVSSNLSLNATLNPDFASVEGDKEKIDLSGWEENFPEKRLFFQEGNEMFNMRYKLFYSRRIGDISYGAKFAGKVGDYSLNIINTRSIENAEMGIPAAFNSVVRVKKDILKSSSLGFTLVDKTTDIESVRSFGLDWILNPGNNWKITGQLIGSTPGDFIEHSGGFIRVAHESNKHHIHIRYSNLGEKLRDNVNQMGFINDDDRKEVDSDLIYTFWFKQGLFRYIDLGTMVNAYWNLDGNFRSSKFREKVRFYMNNKFSLDFYYENGSRLVAANQTISGSSDIRYHNKLLRATLGYNTDASSHAQLHYTFGNNFGRQMDIIEGAVTFKPLPKLMVKYSFAWLDFKPEYHDELKLRLEHSTWLNILSANLFVTNDLWFKIFAQNDTYKERFYLYGQFGWRFKPPFGAIYLTYAGDDYFNHSTEKRINSKTLFLKFTYPISF